MQWEQSLQSQVQSQVDKTTLAQMLGRVPPFTVPLVGERRHSTVKHIEEIEIHCSCRMPEVEGRDVMAQCDSCNVWYHQHCMDIPKEVFGDSEVQWVCKKCKC